MTADHYVYRLYDANDRLLYVGCTSQLQHRMTSHARLQAWWPDVARLESEGPYSRAEGLRREQNAIWYGRPLYNVQHNRRPLSESAPYSEVAAVAERTGIPATHIRRAMAEGHLPLESVSSADIQRWFDTLPTTPARERAAL